MPTDRARVAVVLVRARNPQNIGAVARAMHDLGFSDLRIVNEYPVPFEGARSAVDASAVLHAAREFSGLAEAIGDCTFVLGTTAVGSRVLEHPLHLLPDAAPLVAANTQAEGRVALLFGSEKTGLTNDELSHCHALVTIPMALTEGKHLSMNLGQAAAICLYALAQVEGSGPLPEASPSAAELERLLALLTDVLEQTGYTRRHPANSRENTLRRLVRRAARSQDDVLVWMGILRQILRR